MSFKRILLVKSHSSKNIVPRAPSFLIIPLELEYIAAFIKTHVEKIDIIDLSMDSRNLEYHLKKIKPDLIGISIRFTLEHNASLEVARKAKTFDVAVAVGGYHATALAEELASDQNIDFVIRGEGEETFLELVKEGSAKNVKGITYLENGKITHNPDRTLIKDLDSIPYPARTLRKYKYEQTLYDYDAEAILTSRGCWGKCTFCCEPAMCQSIQRYRDPEKVIEEIDTILQLHKRKELFLSINDPDFCSNLEITEQLCDKLIIFQNKNKVNLKFGCTGRVDIIGKNENLTKKMIHAGMVIINMGIESPNEKHLKLMKKGNITRELQERAVHNIKANGGQVYGTFVIGLPYQNKADLYECLEYAKKLDMFWSFFHICTPLPGTRLYEELKSKNVLMEENYDKYHYANMVFRHDYLKDEDVREFLVIAYINLFNDLYLRHLYKRVLLTNQKIKLRTFATLFVPLFKGLAVLDDKTSNNKNFTQQELGYFTELINPVLKTFTMEKGVHNIIEMSKFLKILGRQKIQITLMAKNDPLVSYIIKTDTNSIEYIDVIRGTEEEVSLSLHLDMVSFIKRKELNIINREMLGRFFYINRGLKAKVNLLKFIMAIIFEVFS